MEVDTKDRILYDLFVHLPEYHPDRRPEDRHLVDTDLDASDDEDERPGENTPFWQAAWNTVSTPRQRSRLLRKLKRSVRVSTLKDRRLCFLREQSNDWQISRSAGGSSLAVSTEKEIVIRTWSKDHFDKTTSWKPPSDPDPRWRCLEWTRDGEVLAVSTSEGTVFFLTKLGESLGVEVKVPGGVASFGFREGQGSSRELIILGFNGNLYRKLVPQSSNVPSGSGGPDLVPAASVLSRHTFVSDMDVHESGKLLVVSGTHSYDMSPSERGSCVSFWRVSSVSIEPQDGPSGVPAAAESNIAARFKNSFVHRHGPLVHRVRISTNGDRLALVDIDGGVSIWSCGEDGPFKELKHFPAKSVRERAIDIVWWSSDALLVSRANGDVTVSNAKTFQNLLGASAEAFHPWPQISLSVDRRVFLLECERRRVKYLAHQDQTPSFFDLILTGNLDYVKQYIPVSMGGTEEFGKDRTLRRVFRLVSLREMTPEELFRMKVNMREYSGALEVAAAYNMNADLVYQTRWSASPVVEETIREYLANVTDKAWVLKECEGREPPTAADTRLLLRYGLEVCLECDNRTEDANKFRQYLDRLDTYIHMLPNPNDYNAQEFSEFRECDVVNYALKLARKRRFTGLKTLLEYHTSELFPSRLEILRAIPETTKPDSFEFLLPEPKPFLSKEGSRYHPTQADDADDFEDAIEEPAPSVPEPAVEVPSEPIDVIREWYMSRATEIDERSGQIDNCLRLVELGVSKGVDGLETTLRDLQDVSTLVYECGLDTALKEYITLPILQRFALRVDGSKTTEEYRERMLVFGAGFLDANEDHEEAQWPEDDDPVPYNQRAPYLLHQHLMELSKTDLSYCETVVRAHMNPMGGSSPILRGHVGVLHTALSCIYACEREDQWGVMSNIYESLPHRDIIMEVHPWYTDLHNRADDFELELMAGESLTKYQVEANIAFVSGPLMTDPEAGRTVLQKVCANIVKGSPVLSNNGLRAVIVDLINLNRKLLKGIPQSYCYELVCATHLRMGNFDLAAECITQLQEDDAVRIVLDMACEYFNSAVTSTDKALKLATKTLEVVPLVPEIKQELDLVRAVGLLAEYGCPLLPVQIRLCANRLTILQDLLAAHDNLYSDESSILTLASLLGLNAKEDTYRVKQAAASAAITHRDYEFAYRICNELMENDFAGVWPVCEKLGYANEFEDVSGRLAALSFAISKCPVEQIESMLSKYRSLKEHEGCVYHKLSAKVNLGYWSDDGYVDEFLRNQAYVVESKPDGGEGEGDIPVFKEFAENTFYERVQEAAGAVTEDAFEKCTPEEKANIERLLAAYRLVANHNEVVNPQLAATLAQSLMAVDSPLALAHLLQLDDPDLTADVFENLLSKSIGSDGGMDVLMKLAAFFFGTKTYGTAQKKPDLHHCRVNFEEDGIKNITDERQKQWAGIFVSYMSKLRESFEARELLTVCPGLDAARFSHDDSYRVDIVKSLARSMDTLETSLKLAGRHGIAETEVCWENMEWLFKSNLEMDKMKEKIASYERLLLRTPDHMISRLEENVLPSIPGDSYALLTCYWQLVEKARETKGEDTIEVAESVDILTWMDTSKLSMDFKAFIAGPDTFLREYLNVENVDAIAEFFPKLKVHATTLSAADMYLHVVRDVMTKPIPREDFELMYSHDVEPYLKHLDPKAYADLSVKWAVEGNGQIVFPFKLRERVLADTVKCIVGKYGVREDTAAPVTPGDKKTRVRYQGTVYVMNNDEKAMMTRMQRLMTMVKFMAALDQAPVLEDIAAKYAHRFEEVLRGPLEKMNASMRSIAKGMVRSGDSLDKVLSIVQLMGAPLLLIPPAAKRELVASEALALLVEVVTDLVKEYSAMALDDAKIDAFADCLDTILAVVADAKNDDSLQRRVSVPDMSPKTPTVPFSSPPATPKLPGKRIDDIQEFAAETMEELLPKLRDIGTAEEYPLKLRIAVLQVLKEIDNAVAEPTPEQETTDQDNLEYFQCVEIINGEFKTELKQSQLMSEEAKEALFNELLQSASCANQLVALSRLLDVWGDRYLDAAVGDDGVTDVCPWHQYRFRLFSAMIQRGFATEALECRQKSEAVILDMDEDKGLYELMKKQGAATLRLTVLKFGLLSPHESIAMMAMEELISSDTLTDPTKAEVPSDEQLLDILLKKPHNLAAVANSAYFNLTVHRMFEVSADSLTGDTKLFAEVVTHLTMAKLYGHAGGLVMLRAGIHPLTRSLDHAIPLLLLYLEDVCAARHIPDETLALAQNALEHLRGSF